MKKLKRHLGGLMQKIFLITFAFLINEQLFAMGAAPIVPIDPLDQNPIQNTDKCASKTFCVNNKMPLLRQGSYLLWPKIKQLSGDASIKADTGWCSAVASTMAISGEKLMAPTNIIRSQDLSGIELIKDTNIDKRTESYANVIFKMGQRMKTSWKNGGTRDGERGIAFSQYFNEMKLANSKTQSKGNQDFEIINPLTNLYFIELFKRFMPGIATSFYFYDKETNGSYKIKGGHALTINGYEDGHLKIYDPWGRIYNVDLKSTTDSGLSKLPIVSFVSGDSGFVQSYTNSTRKIAFKRYVYLYGNNK